MLSLRVSTLATALFLAAPFDALGATFVVNSTIDAVDVAVGDGVCATVTGVCTLRAAVMEANWHGGTEVITLPAGTYTFTIPGRNETDASAGDLDIWANITINGAGAGTTIIDAAGLDRAFRTPLANPGTVSLTVRDVTVQNGDAGTGFAPGGGFYIGTGTRLSLTRVVVLANRATTGGGILMSGSSSILTVTDTTVIGNVAISPTGGGAGGGGIYVLNGGTATVSRSVIAQNQATFGAGILSDGVLNLSDSAVTGNGPSSFGGGGVYISGGSAVATINRSTISGNNSGTSFGAGLSASGTTTVVNSTLSGNVGGSGGIHQNSGMLSLINVTMASNSSASFGSLVVFGTALVRNSIIANAAGAAANNCFVLGGAVLTDLGNNLEFPGAGCAFNLPSDRRADPLLGPLADNGGPTQTHALLANSPAADAADDVTCATPPVSSVDQRSTARLLGSHCDMGAYEIAGGGAGFTDEPLISGITLVRAIHITELRTRIDAMRVRFGLQPFNWTDPVLVGVIVNAVHVEQLRVALFAAYGAAITSGLNLTPPAFLDSPLLPQQTVIRAIHIEQLRAAVVILEQA